MSKNNSQRLITYADIQTFELRGAAVMAMPAGEQRWSAAMELCQQIMEAEPQAFDVAKGWIKSNMSYMPVVAFFEPFGAWVMRHWSLSPVGKQKWLKLGEMLAASSASLYSMKAIAIYTVLRAQVPADYKAPQQKNTSEPQRRHKVTQQFEMPVFLQSEMAERILKTVEGIRSSSGEMVLDRSTEPWEFSTFAEWGQVAQSTTEKLGVRMLWKQWAKLVGVSEKTLKGAWFKADYDSKVLKAISKTIKSL